MPRLTALPPIVSTVQEAPVPDVVYGTKTDGKPCDDCRKKGKPCKDCKPLSVAVVIPCHNYGRFLGEAIESALTQTHPATEVIVVLDDCSDDSHQVARRYPVRIIETRACDAMLSRRLGYRASCSDVLCFLDADDRISGDYIARGIEAFKDPAVGIVTGDAQIFGAQTARHHPQPGDMETSCGATSAALVRRAAIERSGAIEDLSVVGAAGEDWEFWKRITRDGWAVAKAPIVHHHRRHRDNETLGDRWSHLPWQARARKAAGYRPRRKTRIGFITANANVGGVSAVTLSQVEQADRLKWVGLHCFGTLHPSLDDRLPPRMSVEELCRRVDVVYAWGAKPEMLAQIDKPIVYGVHGSGKWTQDMTAAAAPYVDAIWCVSQGALLAVPPEWRHKARLIRGGVDLDRLTSHRTRDEARAAHNIPRSTICVGYIGRLSPEKRVPLIAQAVAQLPGAVLLCCSPQSFAAGHEKKRAELTDILGERILWAESPHGGIADVYRAIDCLVIASDEEGGPLVTMEALALGIPVVTTPVGVILELQRQFGPLAQVVSLNPTGPEIAHAIDDACGPAGRALAPHAREVAIYECGAHRMVRDFESLAVEVAGRRRPVP